MSDRQKLCDMRLRLQKLLAEVETHLGERPAGGVETMIGAAQTWGNYVQRTEEPSEDHPVPWRLEARNVPLADTGDYDGVIAIMASDGSKVLESWNPDDATEEALKRIVRVMNRDASRNRPLEGLSTAHTAQACSELCDRLERIHRIVIERGAMSKEQKLMQVMELSAGFSRDPNPAERAPTESRERVALGKLIRTATEVHRISDRTHDAWTALAAALTEARNVMGWIEDLGPAKKAHRVKHNPSGLLGDR